MEEFEDESEDVIEKPDSFDKLVEIKAKQNQQVGSQFNPIKSQKSNNIIREQNIVPDLFSQDFNTDIASTPVVEVNSKCRIVLIDMHNKVEEVLLMDIPRNLQPKSRDGIQILSIYSDLGKLLLGNKEGVTVKFIDRNYRVRIEKVYN